MVARMKLEAFTFRPFSHMLCKAANRCKSEGAARAVLAPTILTDGIDTLTQMAVRPAFGAFNVFSTPVVHLINKDWKRAVLSIALLGPNVAIEFISKVSSYEVVGLLRLIGNISTLPAVYKLMIGKDVAEEILLEKELRIRESYEKSGVKTLDCLPFTKIKRFRDEESGKWRTDAEEVATWKQSRYYALEKMPDKEKNKSFNKDIFAESEYFNGTWEIYKIKVEADWIEKRKNMNFFQIMRDELDLRHDFV